MRGVRHVEPADNPARDQRPVDLGRGFRRPHHELVEERLAALDGIPRQRADAVRGVMRLLVAQLRDAAQSSRTERRQVHHRRQCDELLARADVARRALASDVLLARLQRQHVAGPPLDVLRLADDAARHLPHVLVAAREHADVWPTEAQWHAQRLSLGHDDIGAVLRRRPVQAEAHRLGGDDEQRTRGVRGIAPHCCVDRHASEEVRLRHGEARVLAVERERAVRLNVDRYVASVRVTAHDRQPVRVHPVRDRDPPATRHGARHQARLRQRRRAVVHAGVRHVHAGQLADQRLELEDRLQRALAHLRLVRGVARQELPAHHERRDDRWREVAIRARAEEARVFRRGPVARRQRSRIVEQLQLRQRVGKSELRAAEFRRYVIEQRVGGCGADRAQHRRAIVVGERNVGVRAGHGSMLVTSDRCPMRTKNLEPGT